MAATKLFISQPMRGKTNKEIETVRNNVLAEVRRLLYPEGVYLIPMSNDKNSDPTKKYLSLWHLGHSLQMMSRADIVYFVDGWKDYPGCRIEHECAEIYGITIIHD